MDEDFWSLPCVNIIKPTIIKLYNLKSQIETLVNNYDYIPQNLINNYITFYNNFAQKFFNKKTVNCIKRNKVDVKEIHAKMQRTRDTIRKYQAEIDGLNPIIKIIKYRLIKNYREFLDIAMTKAQHFLENMTKYYGLP